MSKLREKLPQFLIARVPYAEIAEWFNCTRQNVSQHKKKLTKKEIEYIKNERETIIRNIMES